MQMQLTEVRSGSKVPVYKGSVITLFAAIKNTVSLTHDQPAVIPTGWKISFDEKYMSAMVMSLEDNWKGDRRLIVQNFTIDPDSDEVLIHVLNKAPTLEKIKADEPIAKILLVPAVDKLTIIGLEEPDDEETETDTAAGTATETKPKPATRKKTQKKA